MCLVEQLKEEIKQTVTESELEALMVEIRQKVKDGDLKPQEYYFLMFVEKKHLAANITTVDVLLDLSTNNIVSNNIKVDPCEILAEEFEAIERDLQKMSEITQN